MSTQLTPSGVKRALPKLRDHLTPILYRRVEAIADQLQDDGLIRIYDAIAATATTDSPPLKGSAFREFRSTVAKAAAEAGIRFSLEADKRKSEWAYFEGDDPLTAEIAARSDKEARAGLPKDVVEADAQVPGPIRVYFSAALRELSQPSSPASDLVARVKTELRLTEDTPGFEFASSADALLGTNRKDHLENACSGADVIIVLLSPEYLLPENREPEIVHQSGKPVVIVSLRSVSAKVEMRGLERSHVLWDREPWEEKDNTQRSHSIGDLLAAVKRALSREKPPAPYLSCTDLLGEHARRTAKGLGAQESQVPLHASRGRFDNTDPGGNYDAEHRLAKDPAEAASEGYTPRHVQAVPALLEWSKNRAESSPRFAALLGNVGMGKSTALKQLTLQLLDAREQDASLPLPVLFDLRELNGRSVDEMSACDLLDALLKRTEDVGDTATGADVMQLAKLGNCVLLFDGLDEALVHLTEQQGQRLIQRLWQIAGDNPTTRLAISCRTHYFRTLRDEVSTFLSQGRESVNESDYLVLHMLPFTQEQVREYIASNVGAGRVASIMAMIRSVYNLTELSAQPMLLRMITAALEPLQRRALRGETMRSVDLYESFVSQWLARDDGKHELLPDHKLLLMEDLAAQLWRGGRRTWKVQDLENWMLRFMRNHPDMELHYEKRLPGLWKDDLRTATFVTRSGDDYGFAHTSLLEYFLAKHLLRLLAAGTDAAQADWAKLAPSPEAQRFLIEALLGLRADELSTCLTTLAELGRRQETGIRVLNFAATALKLGLRISDLRGLDARGAELDDFRLESSTQLDLSGARFDGTSFRHARFQGLLLDNASFAACDLTSASFVGCKMTGTSFDSATLAGATFRNSALLACFTDTADCYHTDLISCRDVPILPLGTRIAPSPQLGLPIPSTLTGHTSPVFSGAYSPDGTTILTTSYDNTARIWDTHTGQALHTLTGHTSPVFSGAYSPDGTTILTTSWDGTARIWDTHTGQALHTLTGHTSPVFSGAYSPDGTTILTTSDDNTARIWDTHTGQALHTLTGHTNRVRFGAYSPDGTTILTTSYDNTARIWDTHTGQALHTLTGHTNRVTSGAYSPDGTTILTTSWDGTARIWDTHTGQALHTLTGHTNRVTSGAYSPDGTTILTTSDDNTARIWDTHTGQALHTLTGHTNRVRFGAYSPDGTTLLTTSYDNTARIWDTHTGQALHTLTGHTSPVFSGAYSPDGTTILTTSADNTARIWDTHTGQALHTLTGHTNTVFSGAYSPDGTTILTTSADNTAHIWDAKTGQALHTLTGHTNTVFSGAYSPDGTTLLTTSWDGTARIWDGTARIWDAKTGQALHTLTGHTNRVTSGAYSPDGTTILTTSWDGTARIWDATTGQTIHTLTGHTDWVEFGTYSPDGTTILTTSDDNTAHIWDAKTGQALHTLTGHTNRVTSGAYSPDGTTILTTSWDGTARIWDGTARIWDATTCQELHTLTGHTNRVTSGAYSPDGTTILTTSDDNTARIWDAKTGQTIHTLTGHTDWVEFGTYSPDGTTILTISADNTARIWDTHTGQELHTLTGHANTVVSGAYGPDGTTILTTSTDSTARTWDTHAGQQTGIQLDFLPEGEVVVRDGATQEILGASDGAWRWLGITVVQDDRLVRLPAEMGGMLPPLSALGRTPTSPATA
ncbi:NACHT domain-containing protein [Buchananella felis]|uniref:NACHT domain-containing protein n=1 Tax=Buchananella felis TaxID=3231492 RepID=UPI0035278C36